MATIWKICTTFFHGISDLAPNFHLTKFCHTKLCPYQNFPSPVWQWCCCLVRIAPPREERPGRSAPDWLVPMVGARSGPFDSMTPTTPPPPPGRAQTFFLPPLGPCLHRPSKTAIRTPSCRLLLSGFPDTIDYTLLIEKARAQEDGNLTRLCLEYVPVTFSRRHGDPSRPWNKFSIVLKDANGNKKLNYQGNWRDIFQNWEALCMSYPNFIDSMIAKFVNATTIDGMRGRPLLTQSPPPLCAHPHCRHVRWCAGWTTPPPPSRPKSPSWETRWENLGKSFPAIFGTQFFWVPSPPSPPPSPPNTSLVPPPSVHTLTATTFNKIFLASDPPTHRPTPGGGGGFCPLSNGLLCRHGRVHGGAAGPGPCMRHPPAPPPPPDFER